LVINGADFFSGDMDSAEHGRPVAALGGMSCTGNPKQTGILVIDDEVGFLGFLRMALECEGYTVHTASTPTEAILFYQKGWQNISMVILDFLLPQMLGDTVFDELQRLNPDVRILLLTGCEDYVAETMFKRGLRGYLQKPFDLKELAQKVQDAISDPVVGSSVSPA
jgi:DNA-binding NtrC family response regulator